MITKTYDPTKIVFWCGSHQMGGFTDGTFVKVERNEDSFKLKVGASGETTRTRSLNRSGKVTFTLMASSDSNNFLADAAKQDELDGTGIFVLSGEDHNGTTRIHSNNTWVSKQPTVEWGKELGNCQWVLESDNIDMYVGGIE